MRPPGRAGWDGRPFDRDGNQMLDPPLGGRPAATVWDLEDLGMLDGASIATAAHCFGCTAAAGSSGGALA